MGGIFVPFARESYSPVVGRLGERTTGDGENLLSGPVNAARKGSAVFTAKEFVNPRTCGRELSVRRTDLVSLQVKARFFCAESVFPSPKGVSISFFKGRTEPLLNSLALGKRGI